MADLFKIASKEKYRFNYRGILSVEDLWVLDLEELDKIYKSLKAIQRNSNEESLLHKVSKEDTILNNKIEIVKAIVEDKLEEAEANRKRVENDAKKKRIMEIIADKQDEDLKNKSIEELQQLLNDE